MTTPRAILLVGALLAIAIAAYGYLTAPPRYQMDVQGLVVTRIDRQTGEVMRCFANNPCERLALPTGARP